MSKTRKFTLFIPAVALALGLILIPGSPLYFPNLTSTGGRFEGLPVSHWVRDLRGSDEDARRAAIHALGAIGPEAGDVVPELARILAEDQNPGIRLAASMALWKLTPASAMAVPTLITALKDEEPIIRMNAGLALMRLGEEARQAIPALKIALRDESNLTYPGSFSLSVLEMVALALGKITSGTTDGVPALVEALKSASTPGMRRATAQALGDVGPMAASAAPLLRSLLREDDLDVRLAASEALVKMGVSLSEAATAKDPSLPEEERNYLWQIEHHGNLLAKFGFGAIAKGIERADANAIKAILSPEFTGTTLSAPVRVTLVGSYIQAERLQDAGKPASKLSGDMFVRLLMEYRSTFRVKPPQAKLSLITLSPISRGSLEGDWSGTAQVRIYGEHGAGAPAEVVALIRFVIGKPIEETLSKPGWLRAVDVVQSTIVKSPSYLFEDVTTARGLGGATFHDNWHALPNRSSTGGAYVCDYDRDGILDLLITDVNGPRLYKGKLGGGFEDVTSRCGLPREQVERPIAAWVDLDGDGWEDLIYAGRIYRNDAGQHFVDITDRCDLRLPAGATNIVIADYDRDGKLDLYVTRGGRPGASSWLDGRTGYPNRNFLYRNLGDWKLEDVTKASGALAADRSTFTAAWLDANNDGWPDLYVPNELGDGLLLVNNGNGTFSERLLSERPADFGTMGLAVGDVDNDGNVDIYSADMYSKAGTRVISNLAPDAYPAPMMEKIQRFVAGSQLHMNKGSLKFEQVGKEKHVAAVGWAYGAALADIDNDGWLDIHATAGFVSRNRNEPDG